MTASVRVYAILAANQEDGSGHVVRNQSGKAHGRKLHISLVPRSNEAHGTTTSMWGSGSGTRADSLRNDILLEGSDLLGCSTSLGFFQPFVQIMCLWHELWQQTMRQGARRLTYSFLPSLRLYTSSRITLSGKVLLTHSMRPHSSLSGMTAYVRMSLH